MIPILGEIYNYLRSKLGPVHTNVDAKVSSRATPDDVDTKVNTRLNTATPGTPTAGSLYDELDDLLTNVGADADTASSTGSVHAKIKEVRGLLTNTTYGLSALETLVDGLETAVGATGDTASATGSVHAKFNDLLTNRLTSTRAGNLDNLDASVAGRATPAQVNTEVDNALNTAIPATNTADSVNDILLDQIKPRLPASGTIAVAGDAMALTAGAKSDVNTEVDTALNTAIPATNTADSIYDILLDVLKPRLPASGTISTHTAADVWSVTTRALTDKAGFSLSAGGIDAIWDEVVYSTTTSARTVLSNLQSRLPGSGTISTHAAADIWSVTTRSLTDKAGFSLSAGGVDGIWDEVVHSTTTSARTVMSNLQARLPGSGTLNTVAPDNTTIGTINTNLGATNATASATGSANAKLAELLSRVSTTRAGNLDNLDTKVSETGIFAPYVGDASEYSTTNTSFTTLWSRTFANPRGADAISYARWVRVRFDWTRDAGGSTASLTSQFKLIVRDGYGNQLSAGSGSLSDSSDAYDDTTTLDVKDTPPFRGQVTVELQGAGPGGTTVLKVKNIKLYPAIQV